MGAWRFARRNPMGAAMPNAMEIVTPSLSAGVTLLFHRMHAREELGRMSEYRLELLSESMTVPLDEEGARKIFKLIDALEDSDDVQNVYANFDVSDEIMEKVG